MTNLYDSQIIEILPPALTESAKTEAVSYAINMQLRKLLDYAATTSVYALIDSASEAVIDLLAAELGTQYYDASLDLETKRSLVKNTLIWYETVGTPGAVRELVEIVFGEGEVQEWFEYGDEPFYFRILTDALLTEGLFDELAAMIYKVKNTRSHLRSVVITREMDQDGVYAACLFHGYQIAPAVTESWSRTADALEGTVYAGARPHGVTKSVIHEAVYTGSGGTVEAAAVAGGALYGVTKAVINAS